LFSGELEVQVNDFSGLEGRPITAVRYEDATVAGEFSKHAYAHESTPIGNASYELRLPPAPGLQGLQISLFVGKNLTNSPALFLLPGMAESVESDGDGSPEVLPGTQYDSTTGKVTATLPEKFFRIGHAGSSARFLAAALHEGAMTRPPNSIAQVVPEIETEGFVCPLAACTETSRFGSRSTPLGARENFHFGMDLEAECNSELSVPAGSIIVGGRTGDEYDEALTARRLAAGESVYLVVRLPSGVIVKFLHLYALDASVTDRTKSPPTVRVGASASGVVAWTGNTGLFVERRPDCQGSPLVGNRTYPPHLHVERFENGGRAARVDAFLDLATQLSIDVQSSSSIADGDLISYSVRATDNRDRAVDSRVASETNPPRYLCYSQDPADVLNWANKTKDSSTNEACLPWQSAQSVKVGKAKDVRMTARFDTRAPTLVGTAAFVPSTTGSPEASHLFAGHLQGFYQGTAVLTSCTGTANGACNYLSYNLARPEIVGVSFRVGSDALNVRLDQEFGCLGATSSVVVSNDSAFTIAFPTSEMRPASQTTFVVTKVEGDAVSGTVTSTFDLGQAKGTWTATKVARSFPKCLPPTRITGIDESGNERGKTLSFFCPSASLGNYWGCDPRTAESDGRPGEWTSNQPTATSLLLRQL
jgi:hypothetical protein